MIQDENNRLSQELENNHKDQGDLEMVFSNTCFKNKWLIDCIPLFLQSLPNNAFSYDKQPAKKKPPPRKFCDICDCFDLHETEDCPLQEQIPDSPQHTTYHGSKSEERPYCDTCEVFGHWTDSCTDDQTF
ncbi:CAP-GLY domain-containing linker protein 1 [Goodea atripinnis]|uniref:CAP-GLY domain-containing linker protein 1 n=1 Tax=Goodea atripinnis TaxID=208336 RepID=A0ABV0N798_9TELE